MCDIQASLKKTLPKTLKESRLRLNAVWSLCKSKMICEGSSSKEFSEGINVSATFSGGCGHRQPVIRKEGLRLAAVFKAGAGDVRFAFTFFIY